MATRSLERTMVEGGRRRRGRYDEHKEDRRQRQIYRQYCRKAVADPDVDEPSEWFQDWDGKETSWKYRPLKQWLIRHIGQPWDKVNSKLLSRIDRNSPGGRHITHCLRWMVTKPDSSWSWMKPLRKLPGELYVDDGGILRQEPWLSKRKRYRLR